MVLICKTMSPLHLRMFCVKFVEIGSVVLEMKIFIDVFLLFRNCVSFERGVALHLEKSESSSPKDALCQVWLTFAQWFFRRR